MRQRERKRENVLKSRDEKNIRTDLNETSSIIRSSLEKNTLNLMSIDRRLRYLENIHKTFECYIPFKDRNGWIQGKRQSWGQGNELGGHANDPDQSENERTQKERKREKEFTCLFNAMKRHRDTSFVRSFIDENVQLLNQHRIDELCYL